MKEDLKSVRVIRYVRPDSMDEHSNLGGITFIYDLDYVNRTVDVRYSVCSLEDNFEKSMGRSVAMLAEPEQFALDQFRDRANDFGGFTDYYVNYLSVKLNITRRDRQLLKQLTSLI